MHPRRFIVALLAVGIVVGAGWYRARYDAAGGQMTRAAKSLLDSLTAQQKAQASLAFDDPARLDWHFIPKPTRKGVQVGEMSPDQVKAAHALLHSGLSEVGYEKATVIMTLESILHELEKGRQSRLVRDPEKYYFTVFGAPESEGRWGWSVEGHHLSLNFVIEDDRIVAATPAFFGANPATVKSNVGVGPEAGFRTLAAEEQLAFELLESLSDEQRAKAHVDEEAPDEMRAAGEPHPPKTAAVGLAAAALSDEQKTIVRKLLATYASNMPEEVGRAWIGEIDKAGIDRVHFAWSGATEPGIGHYYRLQGPTFLVEFVNVQRDSAGNPANHIHAVWRSMGGDFGVPL